MDYNLKDNYRFVSSEDNIYDFISENDNALEILIEIKPYLDIYFPDSILSLELCDELQWTTEEKLLLNVHISEEIFFNDVLDHFMDIYGKIEPLKKDLICPIVLFPHLSNESYDKIRENSVIGLVAKTAYFNGEFDKNMLREMTLREIPKKQQVKEIIDYCKKHPQPDLSDVVYDLQLDLFDVDRIIDELEENGLELNVQF